MHARLLACLRVEPRSGVQGRHLLLSLVIRVRLSLLLHRRHRGPRCCRRHRCSAPSSASIPLMRATDRGRHASATQTSAAQLERGQQHHTPVHPLYACALATTSTTTGCATTAPQPPARRSARCTHIEVGCVCPASPQLFTVRTSALSSATVGWWCTPVNAAGGSSFRGSGPLIYFENEAPSTLEAGYRKDGRDLHDSTSI